jgi:hypothetical protein
MFMTAAAIAMTTVALSAQEGARPVAVPPSNPPQQIPVPPPNRPRQVAGELVNPMQQLSGFSVMLVEGDLRGATATEGLTPPAAKALNDLKDFLPYKSYRLLATEWMLGSGKLATRLRGEGPQEYDLEMTVRQVNAFLQATPDQSLELGPSSARRPGSGTIERARLQRRRVSVERFALREARVFSAPVVDAVPSSRLSEDERLLQDRVRSYARSADAGQVPPTYVGSGAVIDTSFTMDYGETVVVGTSRLQGSKALIVLLTAVAK